MEIVPGKGAIRTKEKFGDVQLHVEWASPNPPNGTGQDRGNTGLFLMGRYELQILDSYKADTYADGQAGAIYGQYPPLFNASRPPGEWQSYDVAFRRPRFDDSGKLLEPARVTLIHNGVVVQDNEEILGQTTWLKWTPYEAHRRRGPDRAARPWPPGQVPQHLAPQAARAPRAHGRGPQAARDRQALRRRPSTDSRAST